VDLLQRGRRCRASAGVALAACVLAGAASAGGSGTPLSRASLLDAIAAARARAGLPELREHRALDSAAAAHTQEMALGAYVGHRSASSSSFAARLGRFFPRGGGSWQVGEIIFAGAGAIGPGDVVRTWLASPSHRRILLGREWRDVGLAVQQVEESRPLLLVTADFGARGRNRR
jgi:uncharacterized protein YkwD